MAADFQGSVPFPDTSDRTRPLTKEEDIAWAKDVVETDWNAPFLVATITIRAGKVAVEKHTARVSEQVLEGEVEA